MATNPTNERRLPATNTACPAEPGGEQHRGVPATGVRSDSIPRDQSTPRRIGPFSTGQVLAGSYEITAVLGVGGMGVVYEAHDRLLDRTVAIKAPVDSACAPALRREAVAMAAVHHPNLVTPYTLARAAGVEFLVMERVFGMTLEDRITEAWNAERPIPFDEALGHLISVTDALTAVHRAGVAHRDVKSANVMISGRRVVLVDLGLATPEIEIRAGGTLAGSVEYMAPELILDGVKPGRGPLVDLYALGVVAFELLAGRRPFESPTTRGMLSAHLHEAIPDLRSLRADVPDKLAELVRQMLAKAPEERPESSEAVLWRLNAIRAELPRGPAAAGAAPQLSVLIVDDDPELGALLKRSLQWTLPRLVVTTVTDPAGALARMKRSSPDIAIVDLNMPGMNGVELCMNLNSFPWRTRPVVVAMSGRCSYDDLALLRSLDVYDFVRKDEGFVPRMCNVIGDVRRARLSPRASRSREPIRRR